MKHDRMFNMTNKILDYINKYHDELILFRKLMECWQQGTTDVFFYKSYV